MEIIHLSAECYPVAKAGGLGDVVGALPKYQCKAGHIAKVVMPMYHKSFVWQHELVNEYESDFEMGSIRFHFRIMKEKFNALGFDLYLVDIPGLFDREGIYSYDDDDRRFLGFQIAFLEWVRQWQHRPDIVHCHDHHTALVPFLMQYAYRYQHLATIKTVLTVHNGLYQGWMSWESAALLPEYDQWKSGLVEFCNAVNPLASAIRCAHAVTTVSLSYLEELMDHAAGLEILFRSFHYKCYGILNGIDTEVWNPETDKYLSFHYNGKNVDEMKLKSKTEICRLFELDSNKPLFVFIGRAVAEKGADLLPTAISKALSNTKGACSFLVLCSGDKEVEAQLGSLKTYLEGLYNCYIGYSEELSHKMYAAADFLLMPSRVEPCGLNQMYALRYGTIPIVRSVGGLKDTIVDFGENGGFGLRFLHSSAEDIASACCRAAELYYDYRESFQLIRQRMMAIDHSWEKSCSQYIELYQSL